MGKSRRRNRSANSSSGNRKKRNSPFAANSVVSLAPDYTVVEEEKEETEQPDFGNHTSALPLADVRLVLSGTLCCVDSIVRRLRTAIMLLLSLQTGSNFRSPILHTL